MDLLDPNKIYSNGELVAIYSTITTPEKAASLHMELLKKECYHQVSHGEPAYKLHERTSTYLSILRKQKEKDLLEFKKLNDEVVIITNTLKDYDSTKNRAVRSERIAISAIILTMIGLVIQWLCNKPG